MQKQNSKKHINTTTGKQLRHIFIGVLLVIGVVYLVSVIMRDGAIYSPVSVISNETKNLTPTSVILTEEESVQTSSGTSKKLPPCNLVNPFSGSTDCKEEKIQKFQKPNTEWKTRTLSGITYVFGEGNPKEVALNSSQIQVFRKSISDKNDYGDYGYVTPSIEKSLREFLEDQNWNYFVYCFPQENNQTNSIPWEQRKNKSSLYIQDLMQGGFLDIESFLFIDNSTQRKELNTEKIIPLKWLLLQMASPSEIPEGEDELYSCTKKYGEPLLEKLSKIHKAYS